MYIPAVYGCHSEQYNDVYGKTGKTFVVGIEKDRSRENVSSSSIS